jgi:hypothetical protein
MAVYRISGVWKKDGVITHYAFHTKTEKGFTRAAKTSKADAIKLLQTPGNSAKTWMWNYNNSSWTIGADVEVVNGASGKFLRSDPDAKTTDNLEHLISCNWFIA